MTNREMLLAVVNGEVTEEVVAQAQEALNALDAKNEKRRNSANSKKELENAPLRHKVMEFMADRTGVVLASEVANHLGVSSSKASALLKQLVANGSLEQMEVKVPKVGKRMAYSLVKGE